jgi:hypothetical protein
MSRVIEIIDEGLARKKQREAAGFPRSTFKFKVLEDAYLKAQQEDDGSEIMTDTNHPYFDYFYNKYLDSTGNTREFGFTGLFLPWYVNEKKEGHSLIGKILNKGSHLE